MSRERVATASPPRYSRPFVVLFLATLVVCALGGWNALPFPAWELFSRLRTAGQSGWEAVAVDAAGHEHAYPIASLPHGYRGFSFLIADFSDRSAADRDAICSVWLRSSAERLGPDVRSLRIYRLNWLLSERQGNRAAPPQRTPAWTCTTSGAHAAR